MWRTPIYIKIPALVLWEKCSTSGNFPAESHLSGCSMASSIPKRHFQDRDFLLGEFPVSQFPKLYKISFCMTILRNVSEGWGSKENLDVFRAAWSPCPFQISCSWEQAMVLLTSNPTGQRLESVTDHKFMAKQTFRAWGKVENNWQKNYSGKKKLQRIYHLFCFPSRYFWALNKLLCLGNSPVLWKKIPCCYGNTIPSRWILLEGGGHWQD